MLSRLMTVREQMVLGGLAAAIVLGAGALVFYRGSPVLPAKAAAEFVLPETAPTAPPVPSTASDLSDLSDGSDLSDLDRLAPPAPAPIAVGVIGAVRKAGLYYLPAESRVAHLVDAAGGAAPEADLGDINLAARLIDGTTLAIPAHRASGQRPTMFRIGPEAAAFNPAPYTLSRAASVPAAISEGFAAELVPGAASIPPAGGLIDLNTATPGQLETLPGIGEVLAGRIVDFRPFATVDDLRQVEGIGEKRLDAIRPFVTVAPGGP